MTEDKWLKWAFSMPVRESMRGRLSNRKLRLFACACCRRVWHLINEEANRNAVELAERFADDRATYSELQVAYERSMSLRDGLARFVIPITIAVCRTASPARDPHVTASSAARLIAHAQEIPAAEMEHQAELLREIIGNPFGRPTINPEWLIWNNGTVPKLARTIYEDRRWELMPILGDALEDALCDDADMLEHCRGPGPHVRGCWVVDLILGKS